MKKSSSLILQKLQPNNTEIKNTKIKNIPFDINDIKIMEKWKKNIKNKYPHFKWKK